MDMFVLTQLAIIAAGLLGHQWVGTEHILIAYYVHYNPDIAKALLARVKKELGSGTPTALGMKNLSPALIRINQRSHSVNEVILNIITDPHTTGGKLFR